MTAIITTVKELTLAELEQNLPEGAFHSLGCIHCDLKHSVKCDYYNPDTHLSEMPERGICDSRKLWLLALTPRYTMPVELHRWRLDVNKAISWLRNIELTNKLKEIDTKLKEAELENHVEKINYYRQERYFVNKSFENATKLLLQYDTDMVRIDTPKKVEVSHKPSITDYQKLMQEARKTIEIKKSEETKDG